MIWCHAIPDSSVVFLLVLLFFTPSEPGKDCNFMYPQLHSIDSIEHFSHVIEELKQYLLLDYPVSVPSNLKLDEFCQELWELHLIHSKLTSMMRVSGSSLRKMFLNITTHTNFIEGCKIEDSCVSYMETNITQFLQPIPLLIETLANKMEDLIDKGLGNFSNCTIIQCLDSFTTPVTQNFAQTQERIQSSQPTPPGRSYWGLFLLPIPFFCLLLIARRPCRELFQRPPRFQETAV
ncbi:fms-related tyrosine kinase 3 ligand-like isoform X5 [Rhineura floridana]|uniref:fms-related tyrosine kinase 3 ligand-like isoform X5 n=1 Tax=Rhineura floridana TaxID=261503 RepID=UPI002AC87BBD|nr:fms-related tyrosine kinase 3 ligand-like isoform X5 [Rhineura floridana]XP_061445275.1 fms-related tyrosine kinase 3 ligand-like isoform X5 [Rhineura floridana]